MSNIERWAGENDAIEAWNHVIGRLDKIAGTPASGRTADELLDDIAQQLRGAVEEAEKWKRIAQDRCTCVKTCGDTPEDSGGICKELPRAWGQ